MRRTLSIKRETLDVLDHGDLEQVVAASVSCPIVALRDKVITLIGVDSNPPETNVPTLCHCP